MLNGVLRGGRQLVEQLDMSYVPLRSGGIVQLHLTLKEKNMRSAKNELSRFLSQLSSLNFGRDDFQQQYQSYVLDFLQSAKNQMTFDTENYRESALNLSIAVARFLLQNTARSSDSYLENVEKISSSDLRRVAGKYLSGKKWAVLAIVPLAGKEK
jgi:zinc protease